LCAPLFWGTPFAFGALTLHVYIYNQFLKLFNLNFYNQTKNTKNKEGMRLFDMKLTWIYIFELEIGDSKFCQNY